MQKQQKTIDNDESPEIVFVRKLLFIPFIICAISIISAGIIKETDYKKYINISQGIFLISIGALFLIATIGGHITDGYISLLNKKAFTYKDKPILYASCIATICAIGLGSIAIGIYLIVAF